MAGGPGTGLAENVAAALAYVLGFVPGTVMSLLEPDNRTVRFRASQSIVVSRAIFVLLVWLASLALWIHLIVRTYRERNPRLPVAAEIADRHV